MEKQKRWQLYLILAVIILTLFNILPTIFYYTKPLKSPIDATRAQKIAVAIANRTNELEQDATDWLHSFAKLLGVKPRSIELQKNNPQYVEVNFSNAQDASLFRRFLPRAGALIPFVPAQLELYPQVEEQDTKVIVSRKVNIHFNPQDLQEFFQYAYKQNAEGQITDFYRQLVEDRVAQLALAFGSTSKPATLLQAIKDNPTSSYDDLVLNLATEIVEANKALQANQAMAKRYFASFTQVGSPSKDNLVSKFLSRAEALKVGLGAKKETLTQEIKKAEESKQTVDSSQRQALTLLEGQRHTLSQAISILHQRAADFKVSQQALTPEKVKDLIQTSQKASKANDKLQIVSLNGSNPFVQGLVIDWSNEKIFLQLYPDIQAIRQAPSRDEEADVQRDKINNLIINDIARAGRLTDENLIPWEETFGVNLSQLTNPRSFLALNLTAVAKKQIQQLLNQLEEIWLPKHAELTREAYPLRDYASYTKSKPEEQKLGLLVYAPSAQQSPTLPGFNNGSIYVIARGMDSIMQKYRQMPDSPEKQEFLHDIEQLHYTLQANGFVGYSGATFGLPAEFSKDYIFELNDYYDTLLKATREDFYAKGSKRHALLDFTDVEQRMLAINAIEDHQQEDLLKWEEEYRSAQVDLDITNHYLVPAPTKNPYWQNFKLSIAKFFRGDDRKILKLGLDLSGGKTVRIGLRDQNGREVTNPEDLKQAVNELYTRINKMGVSERTIHLEGNNIVLDFPGSQNMSATDLVKASAMYFHVVNEKFTPNNPALKEAVNQFLQNVWNEAVVTNRTDIDSVNEIAWHHLGGDLATGELTGPRSEYATLLYESGLRLADPKHKEVSNTYNDTLSSVAILRGKDFSEWNNQAHPLLIVFHHYALEGSSLTNIQVGYDSSEGNTLSFSVKSSYDGSRIGSPRDDFYTWTSQFAEDKIVGTPKESYSRGKGWRMAVVLNGTIISSPSLRAALKDSAQITGRFTQREVNQLAADLKAGSLSFTPKILSEENVSPELGQEERTRGVVASVVALTLVVIAMIGYYHFAGVVASTAVLFNILILWGVMQNIGQPLTLPGLAGIVLTIGMAVDANVLVFERIREEFKQSGRLASAIQAGYRKAFSAIVDSNITTIIAALILIQFDSGPVKGFAVTLIIGIISSMFTALFMTRYFFAGWVQNPKHKSLSMSQLIGNTHFDFLKHARKAIIISLAMIAIGGYFFSVQYKTMLGMDFTGGYSLNVELEEKPEEVNYRQLAAEALLAHGATANDFQLRTLSKPNQLRIQLATSMEQKGHPFYQLPETFVEDKFAHEYQKNPRIVWLVNTLTDAGLNVASSQLDQLHAHWTVISGQFSEAMRNNAVIGLTIALASILLYITFRFEFKFALGAVAGLTHDVIITLGILAIFQAMGFAVQIDLQVVGAIMTIIGYSLNDTIIVFDRIREDMRLMRKMKFKDIVNHALNITLSRTLMTSGTTLLVLLSLVLLGGHSIFAFSLVMTIGVIVGTLSSLFIASPVMLYIHNREIKKLEEEMHPTRRLSS
ncbi:putative fusion protein export proteins SecD/SecF [Neochlamydia sp. TUME1]|uniref:protein translocase subunit SecDF n=1 Tax=Neochlamydia sp. TUME1 TaxID=1478174 RepID=UPI00057D203D|nr:protein translocase subunit SecDF [Neochlamydia sp. TUME1]KIC74411.1 putative fusion protein export proteins SecD/SecF [Neochlamydia sp. TUME1]